MAYGIAIAAGYLFRGVVGAAIAAGLVYMTRNPGAVGSQSPSSTPQTPVGPGSPAGGPSRGGGMSPVRLVTGA